MAKLGYTVDPNQIEPMIRVEIPKDYMKFVKQYHIMYRRVKKNNGWSIFPKSKFASVEKRFNYFKRILAEYDKIIDDYFIASIQKNIIKVDIETALYYDDALQRFRNDYSILLMMQDHWIKGKARRKDFL